MTRNLKLIFNSFLLKSIVVFAFFTRLLLMWKNDDDLTKGAWWRQVCIQSGSTLLLFQIFEFLINQNYVSLLSLFSYFPQNSHKKKGVNGNLQKAKKNFLWES